MIVDDFTLMVAKSDCLHTYKMSYNNEGVQYTGNILPFTFAFSSFAEFARNVRLPSTYVLALIFRTTSIAIALISN